MISPYIYAAAAAILLTLGFAGGFTLEHRLSESTIATLKADYANKVAEAAAAKDAADLRVESIERTNAEEQQKLIANYEQRIQNERSITESTVANLRDGISSLRVKLAANSGGSKLSNVIASATGSNGETAASLSRSVAARLAGRYADYNEIVDQLELCQGIVINDRSAYGNQKSSVAEGR